MKSQIPTSYRPLRYRDRWFCYLDLLGFTARIGEDSIATIIDLYQDALREMQRICKPHRGHGVAHSWFSDTFIIYSYGAEEKDFARVEQTGRLFFQHLILNRMPVRGAISFGKLYSQSSRNVFVGPVLIDAYMYGEKQDWLGFVLTPSVHQRLLSTAISVSNLAHYRAVKEEGIIKHEISAPVSAFAFNNLAVRGGINPYVTALQKMREQAPSTARVKYDRAIAFAQSHDSIAARRAGDSANP